MVSDPRYLEGSFKPLEYDLLGEPYDYEEPMTPTTPPGPSQPASRIKPHELQIGEVISQGH